MASDGTSHTAAAIHDWERPVGAGEQILADLFDLLANAHFKKAQPYPRWWVKKATITVGKGTRLTPEQFRTQWAERAALAEAARMAASKN